MMRMRLPQHGQGCSGALGSSGFVVAALMASIGMSGTASSSRIRAMLLARVGLMLGIGCDGDEGLGGSLEQDVVDRGLVLIGDVSDLRRQRKHDVEVWDRQ
jgi:hypothetical protein